MSQEPASSSRPEAPRRQSSFDQAREIKRQRTFSSELSARLSTTAKVPSRRPSIAQKESSSKAAPKPDNNTHNSQHPQDLAPIASNDESASRRVCFGPPTLDKDPSDTEKPDLKTRTNSSSPANILPLDPEKGIVSPDRSLPYYFPPGAKWRTYFQQEIANNHFLEAQLLALSFATGIVDAVTTSTYSVFVSKQTGNTIYLALWAVHHPSIEGLERNIGISMGCFLLGSIFFGHIGHIVKQRRRSWLLFNNFLQCCLVYVAVILAYLVPSGPSGTTTYLILALLSFASGGQISLAICVKLPELNTVMITGALIQLATDRRFFHAHNSARNRRLLFFVCLLAGAFVGASATTYVGPQLGLLLNAIVKTLVCLTFFLNHGMLVPGGSTPKVESGTATPFNLILWGD